MYNTLLLLLLAIICFLFYSLVMGNDVQNGWLFGGNLLLGASGFSVSLTMVSGIAAKASHNSSTLMAVLSFPILIPLLLLIMKVSKNAIDGLDPSVSYDEVIILLAINVMVATLAYILFPYLWRS